MKNIAIIFRPPRWSNPLSTCDVIDDNCIIVFKDKVNEYVTHLVAKLYVYGTMNRTIIHEIIMSICSFYSDFCLKFIKQKYGNIYELCYILQIIEKAFENFKSEHLTFKYFKKMGYLILPLIKKIHSSLTFGSFDRHTRSTIYHRKITVVPLKIV